MRRRPTTRLRPSRSAGWYAGDFHVHAEHSSLGDATMTETFDYAFRPLRPGRRRARLRHAVGLRDRYGMGRDRPLPARSSRQADRPLQRGDHLPRPCEQPRQPALRRPPHRPGVRADVERRPARRCGAPGRRARSSTRCTPAAASPRSTTPASSRRRCPASTSCAAAAPGTTRAAETDYRAVDAIEIATGPAGLKEDPQPGPEPVHAARDPVLGGRDRRRGPQRQPDRRGRLERLAQRRSHPRPRDAVADRAGDHGRVRGRAVRARHPARGRGPPHLREGVRQRRPGPALRGAPAGLERAARDHGRRRARRRRRVHGAGDRRRPRRGATRARTRCSC